MKKLGAFKSFGLLVFLSIALILVGVNFLEADKPDKPPGKKPPKWEWKVGIPNLTKAVNLDCNLYANSPLTSEDSGYIIYENNDFVKVEYWTSQDDETAETHSTFSLTMENTEKGNPAGTGAYSVGFRDLLFTGCRTYCNEGGEGPCLCWVLPNYNSTGKSCCEIDCHGPGSPDFWVMKEFMEYNFHPSHGYDHFSLRFIVYCDVEAMQLNEEVTVDGYMWWLNIWNTGETLIEGNEDYHNIVPAYWILLEDIGVKKTGDNEWTITVDQCGVNDPPGSCYSKYGHSGRYIVFYEFYYQGIEKQKGKSGKTYIESERRYALGAATPFKFITKWTRF